MSISVNSPQHTPAPWVVKRRATYSDPGYVILWPDKGGEHLRRLDSKGNFTEADARLISAAPDLLHALLTMLGETDDSDYLSADEQKKMARAAVDKALENG